MANRWFTEYQPVQSPAESKKGWNFPYGGGDWPETDDWYWVWAGKKDRPPSPTFTLPKAAWWSSKEQRFLAMDGDVYAWRKAMPVKKTR